MTKTFEILNFGHCDLFDICYLGFVILYLHEIIILKILLNLRNDDCLRFAYGRTCQASQAILRSYGDGFMRHFENIRGTH